MKGKTVLITGANTGIGLAAAVELAGRGAKVVLGCRDKAKGDAAVAKVKAETGGEAELLQLDLASLDSVRRAAAEFARTHGRLDVLINNAGLMLLKRTLTADGFETTFGVNHLGHFLLTHELLPTLKRGAPARIVVVASNAHRGGHLDFDDLQHEKRYRGDSVYADSKLANILFGAALAKRLEGTHITVNSVHPGVIASEFFRDLPWAARAPMGMVLSSVEKGAAPLVHLAADPEVEGVSGKYFDKLRESQPTEEAQDAAAAERLWEISAKLVGI